MSRERFDETLTDADSRLLAEVERDLARELAVEPSPEFLARVRAAIAEREPASRAWLRWLAAPKRSEGGWRRALALPLSRWRWVPAAVAAAVLGVIVVNVTRRTQDTIVPASSTVAATAPAERPVTIDSPPVPQPLRRAIELPRRVKAAPPIARAREAEVLVEPGQERALLQLVASLRTGRIDPSSLRDGAVAPEEAATLKELAIPLLKIELLPVPPAGTDTPPGERIERPRESARSAE